VDGEHTSGLVSGATRWLVALVTLVCLSGAPAVATGRSAKENIARPFLLAADEPRLQSVDAKPKRRRATRVLGKRIKRGDLPYTASPLPVSVFPLVFASGLVLMAVGGVILTMLNESEDRASLRRMSRARRARKGTVKQRSNRSSAGTGPPPPPPSAPPTQDARVMPPGQVRTAWGALGRSSTSRRAILRADR
jgi:hypothetical protein